MARRSDAIHRSRASRCGDGGGAGGEEGTLRRRSRRGEPALAEAGEAVSPRPLRARAGAWRASRCRCRGSRHRRRGALHCAIAEDPHGFILRQGWAALDFGEEREIAQLRRLWESIELEIIRVLEAGHALKESPDYELHRLTTQTPAFFDETARRQVAGLEKEVTVLERQAAELAKEIEELAGEAVPGIG